MQTVLSMAIHLRVQSHVLTFERKDLVVHVRVRWIIETLKHSACTEGSATLSKLGLKQPEFPMGKIPIGQYSCKEKGKKIGNVEELEKLPQVQSRPRTSHHRQRLESWGASEERERRT